MDKDVLHLLRRLAISNRKEYLTVFREYICVSEQTRRSTQDENEFYLRTPTKTNRRGHGI